jgi:hypothetical protein
MNGRDFLLKLQPTAGYNSIGGSKAADLRLEAIRDDGSPE